MKYRVDDQTLEAGKFLAFVNQVWPGEYDPQKTQDALEKTLNITAYEGETLVGCLRILTDGYFFGTITELLVLPGYQGAGDRKPSAPAGPGAHPHLALLRRTAGAGEVL